MMTLKCATIAFLATTVSIAGCSSRRDGKGTYSQKFEAQRIGDVAFGPCVKQSPEAVVEVFVAQLGGGALPPTGIIRVDDIGLVIETNSGRQVTLDVEHDDESEYLNGATMTMAFQSRFWGRLQGVAPTAVRAITIRYKDQQATSLAHEP